MYINKDEQEFNDFMSKLIEKFIKTGIEIEEDYNKLSPNAKIMADNARQNALRCASQIHNINELFIFLTTSKNNIK